MQLSSVQVRLFRNIVDSGMVKIAPDVTCLVGQNESGKTALLQAIYRLNPVYKKDAFDVDEDYPRWRLVQDRRSGDLSEVFPITCVFELDASDLAAVADVFGPGVVTGSRYELRMDYAGNTTVDIGVNELKACANMLDAEGIPDALRSSLVVQPLSGLLTSASVPPDDGVDYGYGPEDVARLVAIAQTRLNGEETVWGRVVSILRDREPRFFYFSEYQGLPGRIDVVELAGDDEPGASSIQTARALLKLAQTSTSALTSDAFEGRKAELEAVSNDLTRQVFEYWKQNRDLSVVIDVDKVLEQDPSGQQVFARYLDVRVRDGRHGFTNNFARRSSGFQWFFSFLAAFSEFETYEHGIVVLLDEPALTLHGRAQADFLRFIENRLAPNGQVIYTTHSPFMVDTARLDRVRIVEDRGPELGSVVTDEVLGVADDSLFPLQAALGYDIAQSLFVGPDNLLVEGTSDFTYITVISDHLKQEGRQHLDDRWRVLPAGGATNVPAFIALMGTALQVTVLIDGSPAGVAKLKNHVTKGLLSQNRLLLTDSFTDGIDPSDIEDLFSPGDYLKLYDAAFKTDLKVADLNGTDRIIARISRATGQQFSEHGRPAEALLRNRDKLLPGLSGTTLDRFERLFIAINQMLT